MDSTASMNDSGTADRRSECVSSSSIYVTVHNGARCSGAATELLQECVSLRPRSYHHGERVSLRPLDTNQKTMHDGARCSGATTTRDRGERPDFHHYYIRGCVSMRPSTQYSYRWAVRLSETTDATHKRTNDKWERCATSSATLILQYKPTECTRTSA
jgi:hypothetical protein